ncbi:SDR family NAD(P)-dependent oxidoreductase [Streptomyces sp. NPDC059070]|uniref:SDR family NAD(P)-dependent oxidoreductase n=1 Tax=Streptomyces sp. NPDC059070 TaxID=3346713 RepID=UPI0036770624
MNAPTAEPGRVWLIAEAGRGPGRAFAEAALAAGGRVAVATRTGGPPEGPAAVGEAAGAGEAACARAWAALEGLAAAHPGRVLPLRLDITDRDAVFAAVAKAVAHFGQLDVVVNNAGSPSLGMVEEFTEAEARAQLDLDFFGALWMTQAVLPVLRTQGTGHLVQVCAAAALGGLPGTGLYSAGRFALEGLSESLAAEAAAFGVKVSILRPGGHGTGSPAPRHCARPLDDYAALRAEAAREFTGGPVQEDPAFAARALVRLVESDDPPLRLVLGSAVHNVAFDISGRRTNTWVTWEEAGH